MTPELIIAIDVPTADRIKPIIQALPTGVATYKIGLELFVAEGPAALSDVKTAGRKIFLDLKLHDIPRTVARAVSSAAALGVDILTVHAGGGRAMLQAAAEAARDFGPGAPKLVAVTTLTSLNEDDLVEMGVTRPIKTHTLSLGDMAIRAGIDGLVCSPHEAAAFRELIGPDPILITPGIRLAGGDAGDQKRIATPAMAVRAGASHLVVGRPILEAANPAAAAEQILAEMRSA